MQNTSKKEKLIGRFKSNPRDFTFEEMVTLLGYLGYELDNGGRSSGLQVKFVCTNHKQIIIHKLHSYKCILPKQMTILKRTLIEELL